jgi:polyisoprenoid-binding protein YceI
MLPHAACKIPAPWIIVVTAAIAGCSSLSQKSAPVARSPATAADHATVGDAYQVIGSESLLTIRVYRAGALARAGHNHLVASHDLSGTVRVAKDLPSSTFELSFPVASLTVDEAELRAAQGADFAADVADGAREGTRRNMLGPAVLDADHYPQITLRSEALQPQGEQLVARVQIRIRDQLRVVTVPLTYTLSASELLAQGELPLKQSQLGLAPFTALLGALAVQDEMQVQIRIVARKR